MGDLEQFEDLLLRSARNGDVKTVEDILKARTEGKVNLDISCKGKDRMNIMVLMELMHVVQVVHVVNLIVREIKEQPRLDTTSLGQLFWPSWSGRTAVTTWCSHRCPQPCWRHSLAQGCTH